MTQDHPFARLERETATCFHSTPRPDAAKNVTAWHAPLVPRRVICQELRVFSEARLARVRLDGGGSSHFKA